MLDPQKGYLRLDDDQALDQVKVYFTNEFGSDINLEDGSMAGAFANVLAQFLLKLDDLGLSIHDSMLLLKSTGQSIDDIAADDGVYRKVATTSSTQLTITAYIDPNSPVIITPDEGEYSTADGKIFRIVDTVTIANQTTGTDGQPLVDDDGNALGQAQVSAVSEDAGVAQNVAANTIVNPEQSVDGFYSVSNPTAAQGGVDVEDDIELRQRTFDNRLAKPNGTQDGLTTALRNIKDVKDARVIPNKTFEVDQFGNPPKSTHAYVLGGTPDEIAQCLFNNSVLDATFIGKSTGTATDVAGKSYSINYDSAPQAHVFIKITVKTDPNSFNADYGVQQIKDAVNNYFDGLTMGDSVNFTKLYSPIYGVNGITDATIAMGRDAATNIQPNQNVVVGDMEVPVVDNIDVEVN